MTNINLVPNHR